MFFGNVVAPSKLYRLKDVCYCVCGNSTTMLVKDLIIMSSAIMSNNSKDTIKTISA